jgi:hypothetical protein
VSDIWTSEPPSEAGYYWIKNGDAEAAAIVSPSVWASHFSLYGWKRSVHPIPSASEASEMRAALEPFAALVPPSDVRGEPSKNSHFHALICTADVIRAKALLPRGVDVDERKQGRDL